MALRRSSSNRRHYEMSANELADLRCPIGLALMADPVIAADGHLYDRENIQKHIQVGQLIAHSRCCRAC